MRRTIILAVVAALLGGGILITQLSSTRARMEPLQEMARMRPTRAFAARISIPTRYHGCTATPPPPGDTIRTVTTETCGRSDEGSLDVGDLAGAGQSTDPDSLQASALAALLWPDRSKEEELDDVITRLNRAERVSTRRVAVLVDLSAAHLRRAERKQNQLDLFEAIDYAGQALELEPRNTNALFNLALALQAAALDEAADPAWDAYLAVDSTSSWADEARDRRSDLKTTAVEILYPGPNAADAAVVEFARLYPQEAREYGWEQVLSIWGAAAAGGDSACAASHLHLAERLSRALERRQGGDASLADAVRAIRQVQGDREATATLARAHRAYAIGMGHFQKGEFDAASASFARVANARPSSAVLRQWARLFDMVAQRRMEELPSLLAQVDSSHHPALAARGRMLMGRRFLLARQFDSARMQFHSADLHFRHAGETKLNAGVWSMQGELAYQQGDTLAAYRAFHRAHLVLRSHRGSITLRNHLSGLAQPLFQDQMRYAALQVLDEDVLVASRTPASIGLVDALQARARARTVMGDLRGAERDFEAAVAHKKEVPADPILEAWALSVLRLASRDTVSARARDSVVDALAENSMWLVPALKWSADLRIRKGDLDGAVSDVERIIEVTLDAMTSPDPWERGAMLEQARSSVDALVMLNLRRGRPADALRALERGRLSFGPWRAAAPVPTGRLTAPHGHVAVDYALIGDTLITWRIRADTIRVLSRRVDRDRFMLTVEQVTAALESPERAAAALPGLRLLYDWLIRPVRGSLGPAGTPLVIVADGEVAGVPFAALQESSTRKYLVQDYPLRYAPTLSDAGRPSSSRPRSGPALLIANPAFDRVRYPTLYPLDGAMEEVDALGRFYPDSILLQEDRATRAAFLQRAPSASIIHYAGHAIFDDARPERSYLVLAGADTTGRLTADAVSRMRLNGVRLVVLSACRTLRSREGRSGGFAGLSGAMLTAGAGGVVGSLWAVDDTLTAPLMTAFHTAYRTSPDPATALRTAQLAMLNSGGVRASPAAWAGFRYTGEARP
jgi:CHAT domain-containing protein